MNTVLQNSDLLPPRDQKVLECILGMEGVSWLNEELKYTT